MDATVELVSLKVFSQVIFSRNGTPMYSRDYMYLCNYNTLKKMVKVEKTTINQATLDLKIMHLQIICLNISYGIYDD